VHENLSERLSYAPELLSALLGLSGQYLAQGKFRRVYELAEELQRLAQAVHDPGLLLRALTLMGSAEFEMGEFLLAKNHLETAISLYDRQREGSLVGLRTVYDPGVACLGYAGATLWHLGYPDQALTRSDEAFALAQELSNPLNLALAELLRGYVRMLRREARAAQDIAERALALCSEQGFTFLFAGADRLQSWALIDQGNTAEAIAQMQKDVASLQAAWKGRLGRSARIMLIEAWIKIARVVERLSAASEMLAIADENQNGYQGADISRLKGELLLSQGRSKLIEAESCFQRAIEIARKQSAKSIELCATTSLARLLAKQDRRDEARAMLADIYNWFTEGFATAHLKDAKALLEELDT